MQTNKNLLGKTRNSFNSFVVFSGTGWKYHHSDHQINFKVDTHKFHTYCEVISTYNMFHANRNKSPVFGLLYGKTDIAG